MWRPGGGPSRLTPRLLQSFLIRAPRGSLTWLALAKFPAAFRGWDLHADLAASQIDELRVNTTATIAPYSKRRVEVPALVQRPYDTAKATTTRTVRASEMPGAVQMSTGD